MRIWVLRKQDGFGTGFLDMVVILLGFGVETVTFDNDLRPLDIQTL
jgi:hypothetical protein